MSLAVANTAWASGLYEGEGSLTTRSGPYPQITLQLRMTDEEPVRRIHKFFQAGTICGPLAPPGNPGHWKPQWLWQVSNRDDLARIFMAMKDYLSSRRREQFKTCVRKARPKRNAMRERRTLRH